MITDFNSMPIQIDKILSEVQAIKKMVEKLEKPEEIPKRLTFERALEFLAAQSYIMSPSKLYKLCQAKKIPHYHFGNRLVFDTNELTEWVEQTIKKGKYYETRNK